MVFYYLGGNRIFALRSSMWLAHKLFLITTPVGCGEPDPVQPFILGGPGFFAINGSGYLPKKGTHDGLEKKKVKVFIVLLIYCTNYFTQFYINKIAIPTRASLICGSVE